MLILVTGVPGSGKTLYAVGLLQNYVKENEEAEQRQEPPRGIYANIDGLTVPGVLPSPDDWRDVPDGSVVFYDECQQAYGPDGAGRSSRPDIQELETHRHRGIDIILITQHPKLLHAHVRRLIGKHYHLFRMYGTENAKVFRRDGCIDVDKPGTLLKEDTQLWTYPKKDFGLYKSATVHTHKRQLPSYLKRAGIGMAVAVVISGLFFWKASEFFWGYVNEEKVEETNTTPVSDQLAFQWEETTELEPATGYGAACIGNESRCQCYDERKQLMTISQDECLTYLEGPWVQLPTYPQSSRPAGIVSRGSDGERQRGTATADGNQYTAAFRNWSESKKEQDFP